MDTKLFFPDVRPLSEIAANVHGQKHLFVNTYTIEDESTGRWALIDAGLKWSGPKIKAFTEQLFGDRDPSAIILTHGHFDHVGGLNFLLKAWPAVPVYAHEYEMPYLTGKSPYPPADPSVGGGLMALFSFLYPCGPIDISQRVRKLPGDGSVPDFPEWKFINTPGHSPGHISLFRERDKLLIAGDAFLTTQNESAYNALSYEARVSGPPKYFTCNWASAKISVLKLAALQPEIVAAGHGKPMSGIQMQKALGYLSRHFDRVAAPRIGRYVTQPALTSQDGIVSLPEEPARSLFIKAAAITSVLFALGTIAFLSTRKR
jgi:glyoxylase-like metal-dependent hydrolase (beta-lactamase superfamily II)